MPKSNVSILVMGDENILKNSSGRVTNGKGVGIKQSGGRPQGVPGGLYDPTIFGQKYRCTCSNHARVKPGETCPRCKTYVFNDEIDEHRYGVFELPCHTVLKVYMKAFRAQLEQNLPCFVNAFPKGNDYNMKIWNTRIIPIEVESIDDKEGTYAIRLADNKLCKLVCYEYNPGSEHNNFEFYGYEGLYFIVNNFKPVKGSFEKLKRYITKYLIIAPVSLRPYGRTPQNTITYDKLSQMYSYLISICSNISYLILDNDVKLADRLFNAYTVTTAVNLGISIYPIISTSKESYLRYALSTRIAKSGRANIISADVPIDTIKLPRSLLYEALKADIVSELKRRYSLTVEAENLYRNPTDEVIEIFESIAKDAVVVINRQPSLHKYSALAFKVSMWDENDSQVVNPKDIVTIGLNVQIVEPFNADFDGDQMQFWVATKEPYKSDIFKKMSVHNNWFYEKSSEPIFQFKNSLLLGLVYGSRKVKYDGPDKVYDSLTDIKADFRYDIIKYDQQIEFNGNTTTYGRERLAEILGFQLDDIKELWDDPNKPQKNVSITKKNAPGLVIFIGYKYPTEKVKVMKDLYDFSKEIITLTGSSITTSGELYNIDPDYPEINEIVKNPNLSEKEKWVKIDKILPGLINEKVKEKAKKLDEARESGAKVKDASLDAILGPQIEFRNGKLIVRDESFLTGLQEDTFIHHVTANRDILDQKASLVPAGGYLTRQLVDLCIPLIYKNDELSNDTVGILTKKKLAIGRTDLSGKIVPENNSDDLIRIKSCLTAKDNTGFVVKKDEISNKFWDTYNILNAKVGVSFATGLTENITQSALGLKHGGTIFKPSQECLNNIPETCTVTKREGDKIILNYGGKDHTYPLPKNIVLTANTIKGVIPPNEAIYYIDNPMYIDYGTVRLLKFLGAKDANEQDFNINKTHVKGKSVYALCDGVIKYNFIERKVTIGKFKFDLYDDEIYYYADGDKVKFGDKICSGIGDINEFIENIPDKGLVFYLVLDQLSNKKHGLGLKVSSTEAIEFMLKRRIFTGGSDIPQSIAKSDYVTAASSAYAEKELENAVDTTLDDSLSLRLIFDRGNTSGLGEDNTNV